LKSGRDTSSRLTRLGCQSPSPVVSCIELTVACLLKTETVDWWRL